jgi:hypothetical protein
MIKVGIKIKVNKYLGMEPEVQILTATLVGVLI